MVLYSKKLRGGENMFNKNLKYLREKAGMEQIDLAYQLGRKSSSSISEWEKGKYTPKVGVLAEIASIFNVDMDDMMNYDLSLKPTNVIEIKETKSIPLLGSIACGEPILAENNISEYISFPAELLPKGGKFFFLSASGDSMEPNINNGSLVLIRKQSNVENGEIAAVIFDDATEATLKRVNRQGKMMMLIADNTNYPPIIVDESTPIRIVGKAIKTLNNL